MAEQTTWIKETLEEAVPLSLAKKHLAVDWDEDDEQISGLLQVGYGKVLAALKGTDPFLYDPTDSIAPFRVAQARQAVLHAVREDYAGLYPRRMPATPSLFFQAVMDLQAAFAEVPMQALTLTPLVTIGESPPDTSQLSLGQLWYDPASGTTSILIAKSPDNWVGLGGSIDSDAVGQLIEAQVQGFARTAVDLDDITSIGPSDVDEGGDEFLIMRMPTFRRMSIGAMRAFLVNDSVDYDGLSYDRGTSVLSVASRGGETRSIDLAVADFARTGNPTLVPTDKVAAVGDDTNLTAYMQRQNFFYTALNPDITRTRYAQSTRVQVAFGSAQYQVPGSTIPTHPKHGGTLYLTVDNDMYMIRLQDLLDKALVAPAASLSAANAVAIPMQGNAGEHFFLARRTDSSLAFSATEVGSYAIALEETALPFTVPDPYGPDGMSLETRNNVYVKVARSGMTGGLTEAEVNALIRKAIVPVDSSLDTTITGVLGADGDVNAANINADFTDADGTTRVLNRLYQDGQTDDLNFYVAGNVPQAALTGIIFDLNGARFHVDDANYDGYNGTVTEWQFVGATAGSFKVGANTLVIYEPVDAANFLTNSPGTGQPWLGTSPAGYGDLDATHIQDGTITNAKLAAAIRDPAAFGQPGDVLSTNAARNAKEWRAILALTAAQIIQRISAQTGADRLSYSVLKDVPATVSGIQHTPQRVATLPSTVEEGADVYLTAAEMHDYAHIVPHPFAGGPIDGEGFGTRGWYEDKAIDYGEGTIYGSLPHILLVSDSKVAIAAANDPSTGLIKLYLGSTEYALTRDPGLQNVNLGNIDGATLVDVYSITGGLPAGNWEQIKLEGPTGTFIPPAASLTHPAGLYHGHNDFWYSYLFDAPPGNVNLPFKVPVEQSLPATPVNKDLTFTAPAQPEIPYVSQNPFDDVLRVEMQTGAGQPRENEYTVVMEQPVSGNDVPTTLQVGTERYALTPVSGASDHSFHTGEIPVAERVSATALMRGMDIQYADGAWAEGGAGATIPYVLELHELQRALNDPHSGSAFPAHPFEGEIFQLTHSETVDGVRYAAGTYIYLSETWGVPNVRTQAEAEALVRRLVSDWAEAGNTDELPITKLPFDTLQDMILQSTDERYYRSQDLPYPASSRLAQEDIARAILQAQQHRGGLPIRARVAFPAYTNPAWQAPPGQSNHGYTTGSSNVRAINLPSPFEDRMILWPATHYQAALRDRLQFYLSDDFESNRLPTHIGIANGETGAVTRLLIARDSRRGEWTSAPLGVAALRVPVGGATRYLTLYNAAGNELILNKELFGQAGVEVKALTYNLWRLDAGNNKAQLAGLNDNQWATPSTWDTALELSALPDNVQMFIRVNLAGRVKWAQSVPFSVDEFKALAAITSISGPQDVQQEVMLGAEDVSYSSTPNCIRANLRGQANVFLGHRGGQLTISVDHIGYLRAAGSDIEVWIKAAG